MASTTATLVTYKNRTYRMLWIGDTKYGRRAKLEFLNGSSEFWVNASLVTVVRDQQDSIDREESNREPAPARPAPTTQAAKIGRVLSLLRELGLRVSDLPGAATPAPVPVATIEEDSLDTPYYATLPGEMFADDSPF